MSEETRTSSYVTEFGTAVREMEDEQIIGILKKRALYQDVVAEAAVREAIKREIITSEEDLQAPEYRQEPLKTRLFPFIENEKTKIRIRRSVSRGLLLAGLLPAIWGMVRVNAGFQTEGALLFFFGVGWMGLSVSLIRKYSASAVRILFILLFLSCIYIIRLIILVRQLVFMDIFIVAVLYLMILYGLFFLLKLRE